MLALIAGASWVSLAHAQSYPPIRSAIDARGVDLLTGYHYSNSKLISIGVPGQGGLELDMVLAPNSDNWQGTISTLTGGVVVSANGASEYFSGSTSSGFTSTTEMGNTLTYSSGTYTYTYRDGTVYTYSTSIFGGSVGQAETAGLTQITRPNGEIVTLTWQNSSIAYGPPVGTVHYYRLLTVANNFGYQIHYAYQTNTLNSSTVGAWLSPATETAFNAAVDYCAPTALTCSYSQSWPTVTYTDVMAGEIKITDSLGLTTTFNGTANPQVITSPGGVSASITTNSSGQVTSWSNGVGTWTYNFSLSGSTMTATVTDPDGHTTTVVSNNSNLTITSATDALSNTTNYTYDSYSRLTKISRPEGDTIGYTYDGRGNITQTKVTGKNGTSTITTTANFDTTCTYKAKCNLPNWTQDGNGNQTNYTYNTTTGQAISAVSPAGANGLKPELDLSYQSRYAWYKNSSGSIVQGPSTISLPYQATRCATAQTCAGTVNATVTTIGYGSTGVANNLLPVSITTAAGDSSLSATIAISYDIFGNPSTTTDALGNSTEYFFDADRRPLGAIGPLPGADSLPYRAVRYTYECDSGAKAGCDGLVTLAEQGTTPSQSTSGWSSFSSLAQTATYYDIIDRPVGQEAMNGSTPISYVQATYDNANLNTCTATRMNLAVLGSLPASACTLGTQGSYGPDRITYTIYDHDNRPLKSTSGYGTSVQADNGTLTYGADGEILTAADGKGNLTTYIMDTFNRVYQVEYPTPSNGSVSSTTDYEQYTYDSNSNITQDRRRDGTVITYGYDALNRVGTGYNGATYSYDNFGRMTSASYGGQTQTYGYDALSRSISEAGPLGTVSRQYDLDGRKTRLTYPDGYYVNYSRYNTGELLGVTDSSGVTLMGFVLNSLGQLTTVDRNYGQTQALSYGSDLRLSSIGYTFATTSQNVTFSYGYDPAGGIVTASPNNSAYSWTNSSTSSVPYAADGQNKYTEAGSATMAYDGRGNLQTYGSIGYATDALNRLTSANSVAMSYDPASRLYQTTAGSTSTQYLYDGGQIIAEYSGGVVQNRYIPSDTDDEPVIWYSGSGTSSVTAQWLLYDGRGSVVAVGSTGTSNTTVGINTYGPWGESGAGNIGRFQYKGMPFIQSASLYHARARDYIPGLGRFAQSDPIGYGDGMNFYAFVHNGPIGGADPSGLDLLCSDGYSGGCKVFPYGGTGGAGTDAGPDSDGSTYSGGDDSDATVTVTGSTYAWPTLQSFYGGGFSSWDNFGSVAIINPITQEVTVIGQRPPQFSPPQNNQPRQNNACSRAATPLTDGLDKLATYTQRAAGTVAIVSLAPQLFGGPVNPVADAATGAGEALAGVLEVASLSASAVSGGIQLFRGNGVSAAATALGALLGPATGMTGAGSHIANTIVEEAATAMTMCGP